MICLLKKVWVYMELYPQSFIFAIPVSQVGKITMQGLHPGATGGGLKP